MLNCTNISYSIGGKSLLKNVDWSLGAGQMLAVVGPNGAGKSTLMRVLAGELTPECGEVMLGGDCIGEMSIHRRARCRAMMRQSTTADFDFCAFEIVLMGRNPHCHGGECKRDFAIVREAMEATEVWELRKRRYPTLSGGEQQRLQLARTLAQIWDEQEAGGLRMLLLDEPTSALDMAHQHRVLAAVRDFITSATVVVAIFHDLNLAAQYADRILFLRGGHVDALGTPEAVITPEQVWQTFRAPVCVMGHPTSGCPVVLNAMEHSHHKQNPLEVIA